MIVTTKQLFQSAYGNYAVGAYNINNLEQTVGLFRGNLGKSKSNDEPTNPAKTPLHPPNFSRRAELQRQAFSGGHDSHGRPGFP